MTKTNDTPTIDELRGQLTEAERAVAEAEQAVGAAALDGKPSPPGATERLRKARDERERVARAIDERARRDADAAERARLAAESAEREKAYRWLAVGPEDVPNAVSGWVVAER